MSHSFKSSVFPAVNGDGKIVNISIYLIPKSIIYRYATMIKTENSLKVHTGAALTQICQTHQNNFLLCSHCSVSRAMECIGDDQKLPYIATRK